MFMKSNSLNFMEVQISKLGIFFKLRNTLVSKTPNVYKILPTFVQFPFIYPQENEINWMSYFINLL